MLTFWRVRLKTNRYLHVQFILNRQNLERMSRDINSPETQLKEETLMAKPEKMHKSFFSISTETAIRVIF